MNKQIEVLGIGTPILDHILLINPSYLQEIPGDPYGMELVSYDEMIFIIENSGAIPHQIAGGSCCNAIKGLAALGHACSLSGKLGKDATGKKVIENLQDHNILPLVSFSNSPTAHVACLITPEGKRTCRTFIGAGREMNPDDLNPDYFKNVKLVHIEGYSLLSPGLTHQAMIYAKQAGAIISFDMGSFEIVENYRELLIDLIRDYVSILFSNEEETMSLTGYRPEKGCSKLRELCTLAIVMIGDKGCWVGHQNGQEHYPSFPITPVDTTGAGDLFASGFLHGFLTNQSLQKCAKFGAMTGSTIVQQVGAEIPSELWLEVIKRMESSSIA